MYNGLDYFQSHYKFLRRYITNGCVIIYFSRTFKPYRATCIFFSSSICDAMLELERK